ncbi:MAG: ATP-binding protein [Pseudomonadota bacterium]
MDNHVLSVDEPIRAGDAVVGWLTLRAFDGTANALATHYAKKQVRTLWIVALVAFVVASAVSIGLARHLVGRVKPIAHGARRLADGHWEMRVSVAGNDELSDLSEDFNRLAKTLSETEEARKQWVADIAHELRTPLSVLRAQVEAIQDGVRANTSETFQTLHDEVRHLTRLVDDLYQLSMSDLGALDYHMVQLDWGDLVRNAADQFAPRFEAADLRLVVQLDSPPITLSGDRQRLDQLLSNLFENSLRYTDPGGRVEVKLRADPRSVALTICDSAPGVDAEHAARLFERLYRVEASRSRRFGGSGLGLSICRNIVEAHQGSIVARSSPLGGLEITVTLPA